jgi:uncharacterized protein
MRCSLRPLDALPGPRPVLTLIEQLGSNDRLVHSTDYPHWQFDTPAEALPKSKLPDGSDAKVMAENARALYKLPVCAGRA